ncbi:1181_t:CDS:2, partial [Funneliformis mosseae]
MINYFENIVDEVKINFFKNVENPINLALSSRSWARIAEDPLGPSFIDVAVCQDLFARKVIISRYFIQRLLMHFGSNLPISVFTYLLEIGFKQLAKEMPLKGNDMELFHFLSAGPHVINYAPGMLRKNLKNIEELILVHMFIPFPPRPKLQLDLNSDPHIHQPPIPEEYPPKDGFENNRQLNVIARAILIHPDLVNLWKEIGYSDICNDVNDLVMQGALLILFPPTPASDWNCPTVSIVIARLKELIKLGFQLKYIVIVDALHMFEHRLDEIGDILWDAF